MFERLRWMFGNRVVAAKITVNEVGYFRSGEFIRVGGALRRVHRLDERALVLSVY